MPIAFSHTRRVVVLRRVLYWVLLYEHATVSDRLFGIQNWATMPHMCICICSSKVPVAATKRRARVLFEGRVELRMCAFVYYRCNAFNSRRMAAASQTSGVSREPLGADLNRDRAPDFYTQMKP